MKDFLALGLVDAMSTLVEVLRGDGGLPSSLRTVGASMCNGLDAKLVEAAIVNTPGADSLLPELRTALSAALAAPDLQQPQSAASKAFVVAAQQLLGDSDDALQAISIQRGQMVNTGPSSPSGAAPWDENDVQNDRATRPAQKQF